MIYLTDDPIYSFTNQIQHTDICQNFLVSDILVSVRLIIQSHYEEKLDIRQQVRITRNNIMAMPNCKLLFVNKISRY